MRGLAQVKVISSQIEVFKELNERLKSLVAYIETVIEKGRTWIEETENENFVEMNQFLTNEISECMRKCLCIANGSQELCQPSPATVQLTKHMEKTCTECSKGSIKDGKHYQRIVKQIEELNAYITLHSKKIKRLKHNLGDHEKNCSSQVDEMENKTNSKFKQIMEELQAANDFMLDLHTDRESLAKQVEENEEEMTKFVNTLKDVKTQIKNHDERIETIHKAQQENNSILKLEKMSRDFLETKGRIDEINSQLQNLSYKVSESDQRMKDLPSKVKYQEDRFVEVDRIQKEKDDKVNLQIVEMADKIEASNVLIIDLQSYSKSIFSQMERLKTDLKYTVLNIDPIKKRVSDFVNELTTFKACTEEFNAHGTKKFDVLEKRIKEFENKAIDLSRQTDTISIAVKDLKILIQEKDQEQTKTSEQINKKVKEQENNVNLKLNQHSRVIVKITESLNEMKCLNQGLFQKVNENEQAYKDIKLKVNHIETIKLHLMEQTITDVVDENFNITSQVDKMSQEMVKFNKIVACRVQVKPSVVLDIKCGEILTCFNRDLINIGNHYDMCTGIFTAPCAGLYMCSLMIECENGVNAHFNIYHRKASRGEKARGITHTNNNNSVSCLVSLLELSKNDEIYIASPNNYTKVELSTFSYFLCVLIKQ